MPRAASKRTPRLPIPLMKPGWPRRLRAKPLPRHRAVLFALLGAFLIASAFRRAWQPPALIAAAVSVGAFLVLAQAVGGHNAALDRVVAVDWIAAGAIVLAAVFYALRGSST